MARKVRRCFLCDDVAWEENESGGISDESPVTRFELTAHTEDRTDTVYVCSEDCLFGLAVKKAGITRYGCDESTDGI